MYTRRQPSVLLMATGIAVLGVITIAAALNARVVLMCLSLVGLGLWGLIIPLWSPVSQKLLVRKMKRLKSDPVRFIPIEKEAFEHRYSSVSALVADHSDKSGILHCVIINRGIFDFLEFDNEQDRIMFRLAQ